MALEQDFAAAQERVKKLAKRPSNDQLLALYGLFKQATEGDVTGKRPGMLDMVGRAKHDAWTARRGTDKAAAMQAYVALVESLVKTIG
ncbi:acyl-CoA-binding protein [Anaeromyxobacter oryzae]|uniref:Acyl-CoA-binding protein n=1 Tax=Anaeromyxobacter oryzae TaxID=2918170 RepID=A0ABN6MYK8_9BACT|nr:acyl-CoA-binding protein [Anaeromyxobacter oryzae]BDG05701.1 acyl-CoA-binding protein [Anaeromyxobacter oryzae]